MITSSNTTDAILPGINLVNAGNTYTFQHGTTVSGQTPVINDSGLRVGVLLDADVVAASAVPSAAPEQSIPAWSDRVHNVLKVISTAGASLLVRDDS